MKKNYIKRFLYWSFVNSIIAACGLIIGATVILIQGLTWHKTIPPELIQLVGWYILIFSALLAWLMEDTNVNTDSLTRDPGL